MQRGGPLGLAPAAPPVAEGGDADLDAALGEGGPDPVQAEAARLDGGVQGLGETAGRAGQHGGRGLGLVLLGGPLFDQAEPGGVLWEL